MHQAPNSIHNNGDTSGSTGLLCGTIQVPLFLSSRICPPRKYSYLHYMHFID